PNEHAPTVSPPCVFYPADISLFTVTAIQSFAAPSVRPAERIRTPINRVRGSNQAENLVEVTRSAGAGLGAVGSDSVSAFSSACKRTLVGRKKRMEIITPLKLMTRITYR